MVEMVQEGLPRRERREPRLGEKVTGYGAEFIGTGLLLLLGLSGLGIFLASGPIAAYVSSPLVRRGLAVSCFGGAIALVAYSPGGRRSGAHLNPALTLAFWILGRMRPGDLLGYVGAQVAGASVGALAAISLYRPQLSSLAFGVPLPLSGESPWVVLLGEAGGTAILVLLILVSLSFRRSAPFTPILVWLVIVAVVLAQWEWVRSLLNPVRGLGPSLVARLWVDQWAHWAGPLLGTALVAGGVRGGLFPIQPLCAKLAHPVPDSSCLFLGCLYREVGSRGSSERGGADGGGGEGESR